MFSNFFQQKDNDVSFTHWLLLTLEFSTVLVLPYTTIHQGIKYLISIFIINDSIIILQKGLEMGSEEIQEDNSSCHHLWLFLTTQSSTAYPFPLRIIALHVYDRTILSQWCKEYSRVAFTYLVETKPPGILLPKSLLSTQSPTLYLTLT